jgi:hypothetical protein
MKEHFDPSLTFFQFLNPFTVNASDPIFSTGFFENRKHGKQKAASFVGEYSNQGKYLNQLD